MSTVVRFPRQPVAAIIVRRATAGPHPFLTVPRTRAVAGKPSSAIGEAYGARTIGEAIMCAKIIAERTGLPIIVDPAAERDDGGPVLAA